jgi:hypothetical protein
VSGALNSKHLVSLDGLQAIMQSIAKYCVENAKSPSTYLQTLLTNPTSNNNNANTNNGTTVSPRISSQFLSYQIDVSLLLC